MLDMKSIMWVLVIFTFIRWFVSEKILRGRRRLPPGPMSLPIIGNLHNLSKKPHKSLAELAKIHGPLMLLRFGFINTIVVSSPEVAKEVMQKKDTHFFDRMVPDCLQTHSIADYSITMMPVNNRWKIARKIAITLLFSSKRLDANQSVRMKKMKDIVSYLNNHEGVVVNIGQLAFDINLNLLSNTFFSMELADPNSEVSRQFKLVTSCCSRDMSRPNLADLFPILKGIDPQGIRRSVTTNIGKMLKIFDDIIEKRLATRNNKAVKTNYDMLDALLDICYDKSEDFEFQQIRYMLLDIFLPGSETSSTTLEWAMAELLHEPTKLKVAQEELNRVVGRGNFIKETDFSRLPYLLAILNETFRLHPAVPLLLPRKASSTIEVHGFKVPKDSQVLVNVWAIGRDPSLWTNPNKFEPERFLDSDVDAKGNYFQLLPFGSGRRICVGLSLAIRMMPLMLGNLLNFFDWKLEEGVEPENMNMDDKFGAVLQKSTPLYAIPIAARMKFS